MVLPKPLNSAACLYVSHSGCTALSCACSFSLFGMRGYPSSFVAVRHEPLYTVCISDLHNIHSTDEASLKPRFDREARAPDKELVWKWLKERGTVRDVLRGELQWEDLMDEVRMLASHQRDMFDLSESVSDTSQDTSRDTSRDLFE